MSPTLLRILRAEEREIRRLAGLWPHLDTARYPRDYYRAAESLWRAF